MKRENNSILIYSGAILFFIIAVTLGVIMYKTEIKNREINNIANQEQQNEETKNVSTEIGQKVDEKRLDELIKTLGLEKREKHLPNQLSGGQQQRVSIGRAMINNPALMLADEPTGNLDSKASDEIISLLKLSNKKFNQTVVIITHDLEIAKEAERVITIEDGKIIKDERNI